MNLYEILEVLKGIGWIIVKDDAGDYSCERSH